ncbi:MAG: hypothetical protein GY811_26170 [Myxococcales bacterium]|nr:hypothetical protein [Myxococcales bacterium]
MAVLRSDFVRTALLAVASVVLATACRGGGTRTSADAASGGADDADSTYPAPRTDLVPAAGADSTFELATWNIENFPKEATTPKVVADLIASLDIDMVAVQEIQDQAAFEEVVARLRGYDGLVSSHTYGDGSYQKVGYIYRSSLVSVSGAFLLFGDSGYEFPRPALKLDVVVHGDEAISFTALALHLKAGGGFSDRERREEAIVILENFLRTTVDGAGNDRIAVIGDFNDTLGTGSAVFSPFTGASDRYTMRTASNEAAGDVSFVPSSVLLDHIVTTSEFDDAFASGNTIIPRLDMQMSGYEGQVSDHLPVIMRLPL